VRSGFVRHRTVASAITVLSCVVFALAISAGSARPAHRSGQITLSMQAVANGEPGYKVLIANFERTHPDISINVSYAVNVPVLQQLETTELAAGNAPDILATYPGCGTPISTCRLAKAGYLAPMIDAPWTKRSLPTVISLSKYGQGLFAFVPQISLYAFLTNDGLFARLGLKVPQTFPQLLDLCRKAKAAGTAAVVFGGATSTNVQYLIMELAMATVYGDKGWAKGLRAGKASFAGTPGWQQALQEFIDMNTAGCFQAGTTGTSDVAAEALFAQGRGLMYAGLTNMIGVIVADGPQFTFTVHPFPAGSDPAQTTSYLHLSIAPAVNAQSSSQNQAAAQTFINFIARPKQNALFAQIEGGMTQYQILKGLIPDSMSSFASMFRDRAYITDPTQTWWNPAVVLALQQNGIGLITGQSAIDDVLTAMDNAWDQGPS
jgi:raffinose/stachyose/melibiose transport system substrate-binding protein